LQEFDYDVMLLPKENNKNAREKILTSIFNFLVF
jgi:hypothetical protein